MAKRKKKVTSRRGAKLGKRCPKPGVMVSTRAGLIGVTTGMCVRRRVDVSVMGAGPKTYTRGELRKVPKGQQARIKKELQRSGGVPPMPVSVMRFPNATKRTPRSYAELEREAYAYRPMPSATSPSFDTAQSRYMDGF